MKQKFFFDHIYKAAGSSIDQLLVEQLGIDQCTNCLNVPLQQALIRFAKKPYITGHFYFSPNDTLDPHRYNFTILRHPVDRLISHYFFAKNNVALRVGDRAAELTKEYDIDEYYNLNEPHILGISTNFQCHHYAKLLDDQMTQLKDDEVLALAKQALDSFDLVGTFCNLEGFTEVLFAEAGWGAPPTLSKANVTTNRLKLSEVSEQLIETLTARNQLDIALYDYAVNLFETTRRKVFRQLATAYSKGFDVNLLNNNNLTANVPITPAQKKPKVSSFGNRKVVISTVTLKGEISANNEIFTGENVKILIELLAECAVETFTVGISIRDHEGKIMFGCNGRTLNKTLSILQPGKFYVEYSFLNNLGYGKYSISVAVHSIDKMPEIMYFWQDCAAWFEVVGNIGYYSEGLVKLYPQIDIGTFISDDKAEVIEVKQLDDQYSLQQLGFNNPELCGLYCLISPINLPATLKVGELISVECVVENKGGETWQHFGNRPVCISYFWKSLEGDVLEEGLWTSLPNNLSGGGTLQLWVNIRALMNPGLFVLHLEIVQRNVGWSGCANPIVIETV